MKDFESYKQSMKNLPTLHVFVDLWDDGFLQAQGTWIIVGDKQAHPLQTSKISCYKERRICVESSAMYSETDLLTADTEVYDIERWDQHEIVTKPYNFTCVRYTKRFTRQPAAATGIRLRTKITGDCKELAPELQLKLVDGFDIAWKTFQERSERGKNIIRAPGLKTPSGSDPPKR